MITLTICNHKGGTGKTTSSINLSAALALSGNKVLVIDLDPQGFLTRMMGQAEPEPENSSLVLFKQEMDTPPPVVHLPTFDLIRSSPALSSAMRKLNKPTDILWAREYLQSVSKDYDIVVLDTAAAVTVYSLNALVAADLVVIPILPEYQPVVGGEQTYQTVKMVQKKLNPGLRGVKMLLTMVDGRKKNHFAYRRYLRDKYEGDVMDGIIRTCTTLSVSNQEGRSVYDLNPSARGAIDYANAAEEISNMLIPVQKNSSPEQESPAPVAPGIPSRQTVQPN